MPPFRCSDVPRGSLSNGAQQRPRRASACECESVGPFGCAAHTHRCLRFRAPASVRQDRLAPRRPSPAGGRAQRWHVCPQLQVVGTRLGVPAWLQHRAGARNRIQHTTIGPRLSTGRTGARSRGRAASCAMALPVAAPQQAGLWLTLGGGASWCAAGARDGSAPVDPAGRCAIVALPYSPVPQCCTARHGRPQHRPTSVCAAVRTALRRPYCRLRDGLDPTAVARLRHARRAAGTGSGALELAMESGVKIPPEVHGRPMPCRMPPREHVQTPLQPSCQTSRAGASKRRSRIRLPALLPSHVALFHHIHPPEIGRSGPSQTQPARVQAKSHAQRDATLR